MRKKWWVGAGVLAGVVFALFVYFGAVNPTKSHFAGTCRALPMAAGAGDLSIDSARGLVYLAYLDRTPTADGKPSRGTVMLVDLNAAEPRVRAALISDPPDFRPMALSLYVPAEGARRLFVVDAGASTFAIQVFEQSPAGPFALVKTVRDPLLVNPTAIVAVGPDQLYVTTDPSWLEPGTSSRLTRLWRLAFPPARSAVVYYDGQRMSAATSGLQMAAGIAASPDGSVIYVSEMGGKRVQLFQRDAASGALKSKETVALPSLPNHLHTDAAGDVWIAAHPRVVAALESFAGTPARAPTQVLKLSLAASDEARVAEVYLNDGNELAGGSAASMQGRRLVIGSMSAHRLLVCEPAS